MASSARQTRARACRLRGPLRPGARAPSVRRARVATAAAPPLALALSCCAAAAIASGCGGIAPPDLFVVQRGGSVPGAALTLVVNEEGGVRCNGGATMKMSDSKLIEARAITEELHELASKHTYLAARPGSVLSYYLRDENGTVRFSDNSAEEPQLFRRVALLVLQTAQQVCHLRM